MPSPHTTDRSASRAESSARNEIVDQLKEDHQRAKKAFRRFEKLDAERDAEECRQLVEQICAELKVHTSLEEELFYPALRAAIKDTDLIDEAEVEHATAKQLIEQLDAMSPEDEKFSATVTVLGEYVNHHIKEEEKEMFPKLGRAKGDWQALCDEMNARREELTEQLMPQAAGAEAGLGASGRRPPQHATGSRAGAGPEARAQAASERRTRDAEDERNPDDEA